MCGINAIYNSIGISQQHIGIVEKMNNEMLYRGPDSQVVWNNESIVFGHNRLSIIGIENGSQPLFSLDKSITLVCNGEIYNYLELKDELIKKGYKFNTSSDCEVIIYLYQEYGLELFKRLRGMFAFCLWDANKKLLLASRDRLGKKPLYYSRSSNGIVFSSELKAISKHFLSSYNFNYSSIRHTLKYSHPIDMVDTHINEIKKIRPGEYIIVKDDCISNQLYWNSNKIKTINTDYNTAKKRTLEILTESVELRLRSDVPVAILLSSGIDSTAVAALAKKCRQEIHAITVGYKGNHASDERELAQKFAKEYGLIWHQVELDEKDYLDYFEEYSAVIDEPVCDVAAIAQWGIYKKAKNLGFKVLLSGIGGDELFYGYGSHNEYSENWQKTLKITEYFPINNKLGFIAFTKYIFSNRKSLNNFSLNSPINHLAKYYIKDFEAFKFNWPDSLKNEQIDELSDIFSKKETAIEKLYKYLYDIWLINNCFHQTDKLGLGNSVEVRAPFADHILNEYILSLPLEIKYKPNHPKWLLKETMKDILPEYILNNPKKGFTPPSDYINHIIKSYDSKFYSLKLNNFNQVLTDKILFSHKAQANN